MKLTWVLCAWWQYCVHLFVGRRHTPKLQFVVNQSCEGRKVAVPLSCSYESLWIDQMKGVKGKVHVVGKSYCWLVASFCCISQCARDWLQQLQERPQKSKLPWHRRCRRCIWRSAFTHHSRLNVEKADAAVAQIEMCYWSPYFYCWSL
jgi:hypothetical protein